MGIFRRRRPATEPTVPSTPEPAGPAARTVAGIELAPGRQVVSDFGSGLVPTELWATDGPQPDAPQVWRRLAAAFPATGLWPLVLSGMPGDPTRPWDIGEVEPQSVAAMDAVDVPALLAANWADQIGTDEGLRQPFGAEFPGLAVPEPREDAPLRAVETWAVLDEAPRLGLVRCRRPAEAVTVAGWLGATNHHSPAQVSAVLQSWEERWGAVVAGLSFDVLTLLLLRPPAPGIEAHRAAAEIAAFCPDALLQSGLDSVGVLADVLATRAQWDLWFD